MLAELKSAITIRRKIAEEANSKPFAEVAEELRQARQIVKAFLLDGEILTVNTLFGEKVNGYFACKRIFIPKDDPDQSPDIYTITAAAKFPSPVTRNKCAEALDRAEYTIAIAGDHHAQATSVLYPPKVIYSYGGALKFLAETNLAYSQEVIALINHDPYVGKTVLVPNPDQPSR